MSYRAIIIGLFGALVTLLNGSACGGAAMSVVAWGNDPHGYGSTKKQRNEELADTLAFLLWQLDARPRP